MIMKKYLKPLSEIVKVNSRERLMYGEFESGSNPDPYAGAPPRPPLHAKEMDAAIDEDAQPIFDRWKNPMWDE